MVAQLAATVKQGHHLRACAALGLDAATVSAKIGAILARIVEFVGGVSHQFPSDL